MDISSILEDKLKIQDDKWLKRRSTDEMNVDCPKITEDKSLNAKSTLQTQG